MRRYALSDEQWQKISDYLPGRVGGVGANGGDNRLFVEAVLYRYRAGIPWRDLPEKFGHWKAIHTRFSRWGKAGVWEWVFEMLSADSDNECVMIDSTIVRRISTALELEKKLMPLFQKRLAKARAARALSWIRLEIP